jgi:type IV secretory pathway TraG/TraD family ATPase VirD4
MEIPMLNALWPWKRRTQVVGLWPLETRLLSWSKRDHYTIRDAVNGTIVTGISGSGKTSGPSEAIALAHLRAGFGGIFHAVKTDDAAMALEWCRRTERLADVILFGPKHPARFNFLDYELSRPGEGAGLTDNIVDLLLNVAEIRDRKSSNGSGGGENAEYFANAKKQILRVTIDVLARAKGRVSVPDIYRMVTSAPTSREEFNSPQWRKGSFCYDSMVEAAQREKANVHDEFPSDLELAGAYWCEEFPMLSDRTRTSIVSSVTGTIDTLNRGYMRRLFCEDTNFTPEALADGKILIHTMSVKEFGEVGAMSQVVMKFSSQKAIERRDVRKSPRPIFLHLDEFQTLITSADSSFATTCRSGRGAFVLLTQTLPTVYAALGGGDKAKHEVNSLLANLNLKIMCANSDPDTTKWASELVGKTRQFTVHASTQRDNADRMYTFLASGSGQTTSGVTEILEYELQPTELSRLRTGGQANRYCVDVILHKTGTPLWSTKRSWMRTTFRQHRQG